MKDASTKQAKATKPIAAIMVALIAGGAAYLLVGTHPQTTKTDGGATTAATAVAAGARVLPTAPPLKVEPK